MNRKVIFFTTCIFQDQVMTFELAKKGKNCIALKHEVKECQELCLSSSFFLK